VPGAGEEEKRLGGCRAITGDPSLGDGEGLRRRLDAIG